MKEELNSLILIVAIVVCLITGYTAQNNNSQKTKATNINNSDTLTMASDIHIEAKTTYNTSPDKQEFHLAKKTTATFSPSSDFRIYIAGDSGTADRIR